MVDTHAGTTGTTRSADGTTLGWISVGSGPGIVVVHGTMQSARSQLELAHLLAGGHTAHLLERRGRGPSGPHPSTGLVTSTEVDDLAAVLEATGAHDVLGISSGAIIALRAGLVVPAIRRMAVFEPPLSVGGSVRMDLIDRFMREADAGDLAGSMVTAMLAAEMGPALFRRLPRPLLRAVTRRMLARDEDAARLGRLLRVDLQIVRENAESVADFAAITQDVLLLAGTRTPAYLRRAVDALAATIPGSRRVELRGTNHAVTQNRDQYGAPDRIAPVLAEFFA